MDLGKNYLALAVKDIKESLAFYEKLGFQADPDCGGIEAKWMILRNGDIQIGLYEGMFPNNIMTFNPRDVRSIQKKLKQENVKIDTECDESSSGPAFIMLKDPDGNQIMFDQHF